MTNTEITRSDIRQLRDEAGQHGDLAQVEICDVALGTAESTLRTADQAWAECERVIRSARAQR